MSSVPSPAEARFRAQLFTLCRFGALQDGERARVQIAALLDRCRRELGSQDEVCIEIEIRLEEDRATQRPAEDSVAAFRSLKDRCLSFLPAGHRLTTAASANHAQWVRKSGTADMGISLYRRELQYRESILGGQAYRTCLARSNLVVALIDEGDVRDLPEAARLIEEEVLLRERRFGGDHAFTWVARIIRAEVTLRMAEESESPVRKQLARTAAGDAREVAARRAARFGRYSTGALRAWRIEAQALIVLGDYESAAWLLWKVKAGEAVIGSLEPGRTDFHLAKALSRTGRAEDRGQAMEHARAALAAIGARRREESGEMQEASRLVDQLELEGQQDRIRQPRR